MNPVTIQIIGAIASFVFGFVAIYMAEKDDDDGNTQAN